MAVRALVLVMLASLGCKKDPAEDKLPAWPVAATCRTMREGNVMCDLTSRDGIPISIYADGVYLKSHYMEGEKATLDFPVKSWPADAKELHFVAGSTKLRVPIPPSNRLDVSAGEERPAVLEHEICDGCSVDVDGTRLAATGRGETPIGVYAFTLQQIMDSPTDVPVTVISPSGERTDARLHLGWVKEPFLLELAGADKGFAWAAEKTAAPGPRPMLIATRTEPGRRLEFLRAAGGLVRPREAQIVAIEELGEDGGHCPGLYRDSSGGIQTMYRPLPWVKVAAYEARTGKKLGEKKITGKRAKCPSRFTGFTARIEGERPSDAAIEKWLSTL